MPKYRLTDRADPAPYLVRSRILLAAVIVIVMLMLPVIVSRAFNLNEELEAARLEVTDDQTWVVAQLEVEYLKLAVAVGELADDGSGYISGAVLLEQSPDILHRFDIFYSRVGTVAKKIQTWSETSDRWDKSLRMLDRLTDRRNMLAAMLDRAAKPDGGIWLDELETIIADTAVDVRELSVTTLANLSTQATERRLHYIGEQRKLLIQSVTMVFLMAMISVVALVLFRQIGIRASAERRLSENLYRVFDAKPDAILITDVNRKILWNNVAAAELLGMQVTEEPDSHPLDHYFPGIQRMAGRGSTHPLDRNEQSSTFRDIVRREDGGTIAVEVTRIQMIGEHGDNTTALFVRDISESQRALRALRRERRLAETEVGRYQRFLAVMSHEIRSPLHAILASLDLAAQRPGAADLADLLAIATDAARIALREADAVLENGQAEHAMHMAQPEVFSASEIVSNLVEMNGPTAYSAGTKLAVEIGPGAEGAVMGLRACFWHAVANLLGNAVKFTKAGTITLRLSRSDNALRVEVEDTGPGIDPHLKQEIFRDHYTRDPSTGASGKGAGLGLGLFVEAVRAMSGHYGVESVVGKGSTFWFTFPAPPVDQPVSAKVHDIPALSDIPTGLRILVVDDAHVNRTLIQQMFHTLGLKTDLAESGVEAVKKAHAIRYDLILMDLSMPNMDGYAAAAKIRHAGASRSAAIVALTANVLARQEVDKAGSDFNGLLLKPLRLDELRTWLAAGFHNSYMSREDLLPLIDHGIAKDLLDMLPKAAIESLLKTFFAEIQVLEESLASDIWNEELSPSFHKIAGSAGMLGAGRLRALALDGELACKDKDRSPSPAFRQAWMRTSAATSRDWALLLQSKLEPVATAH